MERVRTSTDTRVAGKTALLEHVRPENAQDAAGRVRPDWAGQEWHEPLDLPSDCRPGQFRRGLDKIGHLPGQLAAERLLARQSLRQWRREMGPFLPRPRIEP